MTLNERCEGWVKSLDFYATTHDGSPEMVSAVAVEMRAEAERLEKVVNALYILVRLHELRRPYNPAWHDAWTEAKGAIGR